MRNTKLLYILQHPDEEEPPTENQVSQNDLATSEQLLPTMTKKGGATQV